METMIHFNTKISVSSLAELIRAQLSLKERLELASLLQEEKEPSKDVILRQIKEDYTSFKQGTLRTRPADDFLKELESDGYL